MATLLLQWGHDLSVVESRVEPLAEPLVVRASMGPRPLGRGISGRAVATRPSGPQLQWGHDLSVVESCRSPAYGLPRSALQWGHDLSVVESDSVGRWTRADARFNGATTSRSWNPLWRRRCNARPGPLQWGHDLSVVESRARSRPASWARGFNGATTSRSWNPAAPRRHFPGVQLQWGHDLSVVESRSHPRSSEHRAWASMGPRPLGRGISGLGRFQGQPV